MQDPQNLEVWQKSHLLTTQVFDATSGPTQGRFKLIDQLESSVLSIESNIAEGATRGSDIEFRRFLKIALSSACELGTQLLVARDVEFLSPERFVGINSLHHEVRKMLWAFIRRIGRDLPPA